MFNRATQSAWLRNASIKDNILFNLPYIKERYEKTLEASLALNSYTFIDIYAL